MKYNKDELNSKRLQFLIENCTTYLNISSFLIKEFKDYIKNKKKKNTGINASMSQKLQQQQLQQLQQLEQELHQLHQQLDQ